MFSGKIFGYTRNKCNHSRQNSNVLLGTWRGTRLKYPLTYFNKGWAVGAVLAALAKFPRDPEKLREQAENPEAAVRSRSL